MGGRRAENGRNEQHLVEARSPSQTCHSLADASPPPRIIYPVDGTLIALPPESDGITLSSEGGRRPLTWLVNGIPQRTGANRWRARWRPDGIGFNQVVVLDALGRRAEARVRLAAR